MTNDEGGAIMPRSFGQHDDHDGLCGHRTSLTLRGSVMAFIVLSIVLAVLLLKVPAATTGSLPCDCQTCHGDFHGANWEGCSGCHQSPPATGSHLAHYNTGPLNSLRYSDTTVRSTADAYIFGCGNCHPLDNAKHRNGTVDIELYNAAAPIESLKAKNPSNAAYDPAGKTCSSVYCHSGIMVTSGNVGYPLTYPSNPLPPGYTLWGPYIMDPTSNFTYAPYTVTITRDYKTTTAWGTTGTFTTCTECHGFPTTTYYPDVQAGVGDSHQWVDDYGYANLHAWNMLGSAVPCATCHFDSVNHYSGTGPPADDTWVNGKEFMAYKLVSIKNRALHVNGSPNVAFDNEYVYSGYSGPYVADLTASTYNAQTKTCNNVSCHGGQTTVKWGSPYRWWGSAECNICHRM